MNSCLSTIKKLRIFQFLLVRLKRKKESQEYKQVSDKTSTVRTVDLSFNHHKEVASLPPEKQEKFLT